MIKINLYLVMEISEIMLLQNRNIYIMIAKLVNHLKNFSIGMIKLNSIQNLKEINNQLYFYSYKINLHCKRHFSIIFKYFINVILYAI